MGASCFDPLDAATSEMDESSYVTNNLEKKTYHAEETASMFRFCCMV